MHRSYADHEHDHHQERRPGGRLGLGGWLSLLPWLLVVYAATGFYSVQPNEQAVVRRCGRMLVELRQPGLHFGFPWGIDQVTRLKMLEAKRVSVGVGLADRSLGRLADPLQAESLTGDRNLILVSAVVQYRIADARAYLFHNADVPALVASTTTACLTSIIASMKVDDILTVERIAIQNQVLQAAQARLDRAGAGVQIAAVSLESAAPPQEVAESFRDVTSAREDRQKAINEAQGYANRLIPQARGEAQRTLLEAEAYGDEVTEKARGDAERFRRVAAQLGSGRELTVKRLVIEAMEDILPRLNKVILDPDARQRLDLGIFDSKP